MQHRAEALLFQHFSTEIDTAIGISGDDKDPTHYCRESSTAGLLSCGNEQEAADWLNAIVAESCWKDFKNSDQIKNSWKIGIRSEILCTSYLFWEIMRDQRWDERWESTEHRGTEHRGWVAKNKKPFPYYFLFFIFTFYSFFPQKFDACWCSTYVRTVKVGIVSLVRIRFGAHVHL